MRAAKCTGCVTLLGGTPQCERLERDEHKRKLTRSGGFCAAATHRLSRLVFVKGVCFREAACRRVAGAIAAAETLVSPPLALAACGEHTALPCLCCNTQHCTVRSRSPFWSSAQRRQHLHSSGSAWDTANNQGWRAQSRKRSRALHSALQKAMGTRGRRPTGARPLLISLRARRGPATDVRTTNLPRLRGNAHQTTGDVLLVTLQPATPTGGAHLAGKRTTAARGPPVRSPTPQTESESSRLLRALSAARSAGYARYSSV